MNRSYSKIRHIQKSNLILENRIIKESNGEDEILNQIKKYLSMLGVDTTNMDNENTKEIMYELRLAVENNENEYITRKLNQLYYEFFGYYGNLDPGDPNTIENPKTEKPYIPREPKSDEEYYGNDDDDGGDIDWGDLLGGTRVSKR